jgi:hypothetical protein
MENKELMINEGTDIVVANANHVVDTVINNISEKGLLIGLGILGTTVVTSVCAICFSGRELKIDKSGIKISKPVVPTEA